MEDKWLYLLKNLGLKDAKQILIYLLEFIGIQNKEQLKSIQMQED
jgi:hypothetical protein